MSRREEVRFVLVTQKTRLQELIARFNTWPQAKFYLEHNGISVSDYLAEHDCYQAQLTEAKRILLQAGQVQVPDRTLLPGYQFSDRDIVVIIGRDGLVANTLKYLNGQPVIAVNPDPARWDGILLPFELPQLESVVTRTLNRDMPSKALSFAQAVTNDGQKMLAVNDLFIGPKSHTSARYILSHGGQSEAQSSSGVIISTGLGSTGWLQSVLAGALGVTGGRSHPLRAGIGWDEKRLQFSVREPFPGRTSGTSLVFGAVDNTMTLQLESQMPENGVIFSDGIESDFLHFNAGCIVTIGIADIQGRLMYE